MFSQLLGGWPTPLKNMSQLGWWHSQYDGKNGTCSKPPTSQDSRCASCDKAKCNCFDWPYQYGVAHGFANKLATTPKKDLIWNTMTQWVSSECCFHQDFHSNNPKLTIDSVQLPVCFFCGCCFARHKIPVLAGAHHSYLAFSACAVELVAVEKKACSNKYCSVAVAKLLNISDTDTLIANFRWLQYLLINNLHVTNPSARFPMVVMQ